VSNQRAISAYLRHTKGHARASETPLRETSVAHIQMVPMISKHPRVLPEHQKDRSEQLTAADTAVAPVICKHPTTLPELQKHR